MRPWILVCLVSSLLSISLQAVAAPVVNYPEVLQKSLYFYDAQRSGPLPADFRVRWRGPSGLSDGADQGVDLSGGFHDAGDHMKFAFPLAYTTTMLAWSLAHDLAAYEKTGQRPFAEANLKAMSGWLLKAHTAPNELWAQVGLGYQDHGFWGSPEVMTMPRPAQKIDQTCPGSDLAGEAAAALAASSIAFRRSAPDYSATLLAHAKELYNFADTYRGRYSDCIKDASAFYNSYSGYQDELVWAAAWLYKATAESGYLNKAEAEFQRLPPDVALGNTLSWDNKSYGLYVLLASATGKEVYRQKAEAWLDYWSGRGGGGRIQYTPGGLAYLSEWGPLRYSAATALMALYYADGLTEAGLRPDKAQAYSTFAKQQIDYMLGDNPAGRSYVVGYGANPPQNPHHRAAHGSWGNNLAVPQRSRHILYGALVGGPNAQDGFDDQRSNYTQSEVALDYNAAFTGAVANLSARYGGQIDPAFPPAEPVEGEFYVESRTTAVGDDFLEIGTRLHDHTSYPARFSRDLSLRYFVSLAGLSPAERDVSLLRVSTAYDQSNGGVSQVRCLDAGTGLYYVEVSFHGQSIGPIGDWESTREVQFRLTAPASWRGRWSARLLTADDPDASAMTLDDSWQMDRKIAVYEGSSLVFGELPRHASTLPLLELK